MTVEKEKTLITDIRTLGILPKAKDACLVMLYGPDLGKRYTISNNPLLIGRAEDSTICVDRDSISRKHAQIIVEDTLYQIEDLGSTNGTYINDRSIKKVPLQAIVGGDASLNAKILYNIFNSKSTDAQRDIVLINAASAFMVNGMARDIQDGLEIVQEVIKNGKAKEKLVQIIDISNKL